jgi:hypothetical protein
MKPIQRGALSLAGLLAMLAVMGGCPNPITEATFKQLTDKNPPTVDISSPSDNSAYTQSVTVQGTAVDAEGRLKSLAWTVTGALGVLVTGTVPTTDIGTGGSFSIQFSTLSFSGPIGVTVIATDWNDNAGQAMRTLASPGSALSSFSVTPTNREVNLNWDPVQGATYEIYYTTNGTLPNTGVPNLTPVAPPIAVPGLENGAVHVFLLKAHTATADYWSNYVRAIPLSQFTLAPKVTPGYREIRLDWNAISGTNEFEIYRANSPIGPWSNYTGVIQGTSYVDSNVNESQAWYYKVKPALAGSLESTYNGARPLTLSPNAADSITSLLLPGASNRVRSSSDGKWAFIAAGTTGVLVVHVDPIQYPTLYATIPTANAQDIEIYGNYAYVADGAGGLVILDISNPTNVVVRGSYSAGIVNAKSVTVSNTAGTVYAFVVDLTNNPTAGDTAIRTFNAANPSSPVYLNYYSNATYQFKDISATYYANSATYLFGTSKEAELPPRSELVRLTFNTSNGALSTPIVYNNATYFSDSVSVKPVTTVADYVFQVGEARAALEPPWPYVLMTVSIAGMTLQGTSPTGNGFVDSLPGNLTVSGTRAYVADGRGLQVVDLTTPTVPTLVGFWNTPGASTGADIIPAGTHAFIVAGALGFQVVTLAQAGSLTSAGAWSSVNIMDVAVRESNAYVCVGGAGAKLQILGIDNPASIQVLGSIVDSRMTNPAGIALSGDYAFIADSAKGLVVLDIRNTGLPAGVVGAAPSVFGSMQSIAIKGDYAYIASTGGLQVFDISDPASPFSVGHYDTDGGGMHDVVIRDTTIYTTDGAYFQPNSLMVLSIANPKDPVLVGKAATSGMTMDSISLYDKWAFVTDEFGGQGLWVVDIDPLSATFLQTWGPCDTAAGATNGYSNGVVAYGSRAYVADATAASGTLALVDIAAPKTLADASLKANLFSLTTTGSGRFRVRMAWKYLFVTDYAALRIYGFSP